MTNNRIAPVLPLAAVLVLSACASQATRPVQPEFLASAIVSEAHGGNDDLLTAGLGAAGLTSPLPPAFADASAPTAAELRRRAIWTNWRGIADLAPGGGYGQLYGSLAPVPGREFHAFAKLPGAKQPHRLMLQLPDSFDQEKRCIVVTASSGSRGVYGAIALAGSWGLSHGCAVAYTDKGTGTGFVESQTGSGARLDGTRGAANEPLEFSAPIIAGQAVPLIAVKHANSGDNPEADWGRHLRQAADFAIRVLGETYPEAKPFTRDNTRVIALGVSNGAGVVLRAAEYPGGWLDGVVAISPNIQPAQGGRSLYDYTTEAALYEPCALNAAAFDTTAFARAGGVKSAPGAVRCASLRSAGLLSAGTPDQQAEQARVFLNGRGWTDAAISAGSLSTSFDLWRAVAVTYASAYSRTPANAMPCGFQFQAIDAKGVAHVPTAAEQAAWWSDSSGIPPGSGVGIVDPNAAGADPAFAGLQCLRALWEGKDAAALRVQAGVSETVAGLPRADLPVIVLHGANDGLVIEAFSGGAYAAWAKAAGRDKVRYWKVGNAQHFDAFLGLPVLGANYVPMLPYGYRAMDRMWAHLAEGQPLPESMEISPRKRTLGASGLAPLTAEDLALP